MFILTDNTIAVMSLKGEYVLNIECGISSFCLFVSSSLKAGKTFCTYSLCMYTHWTLY